MRKKLGRLSAGDITLVKLAFGSSLSSVLASRLVKKSHDGGRRRSRGLFCFDK